MDNKLSVNAPNGVHSALDSANRVNEETPLLTEGQSGNQHRVEDVSDDSNSRRWWQRPSVWWMLPPYFLFTIAFGGVTVPKLNLILELICRKYYSKTMPHGSFSQPRLAFMDPSKPDRCRIPEVQSLAAQFSVASNLIGGILAAITCPRLGALSDRYGRTRILSITGFGMLAGEIITIAAATYPDLVDVNWLFLGYILDGIGGSFIAGMALAHSYAADCAAPEDRNVAFGYFHAALFGGIAVGPLIAAVVIRASGGYILVFYLILACQLTFIISVLFVVPESLSPRRQQDARGIFRSRRAEEATVNAGRTWASWMYRHIVTPLAPLKVLYPQGEGSSPALRRNLVLLAVVDTTMFGIAMGAFNVVIYYSRFRFGWDASEQSLFVAVINLSRIACMTIVLPVITHIVRSMSSRTTTGETEKGCSRLDLAFIRSAVLFDSMGFFAYAAAQTGSVFIISGAMTAIAGLGFPTLQSAMTRQVPADRTGELLGASGLLHSLARVIAPATLGGIYSLTVGSFPQAIFLVLGLVFSIAAALSWAITPGVSMQTGDGSDSR
ncbi:MFS general substrate transporter [Coniochaeta ligniaria NRRL 30616]|uniref:MFS general substrate transporter n=1 Tax=Coniochaeta ligniaria NRRL 30616 TaxID=1408157 RepID=A0A1J7IPL2_9PEZI|nr:MFS general substrate transporter [Coniochaeta ligniaria NRRL 30616]